ncbi:MAG: hypothetical protein ACLR7F_08290 [Waltera sp.]
MSLTNAQYNSIMKDYEQTRDRNRHLTEQRRREVYTKLPEYGRLDESVGELSVAQAKLLLNGDDEALTRLRLSLKDISRRKKELLVSAGYPVDYLERSTPARTVRIPVISKVTMVFAKNVIVFISRNWIFSMNSLISGI